MSLDDFERCTPFEFNAIAEQWHEHQDRENRIGWDQTRFLATAMLQPYSKRALKPTDVARFPWDDTKNDVPKGTSSRERMEEVAKRLKK